MRSPSADGFVPRKMQRLPDVCHLGRKSTVLQSPPSEPVAPVQGALDPRVYTPIRECAIVPGDTSISFVSGGCELKQQLYDVCRGNSTYSVVVQDTLPTGVLGSKQISALDLVYQTTKFWVERVWSEKGWSGNPEGLNRHVKKWFFLAVDLYVRVRWALGVRSRPTNDEPYDGDAPERNPEVWFSGRMVAVVAACVAKVCAGTGICDVEEATILFALRVPRNEYAYAKEKIGEILTEREKAMPYIRNLEFRKTPLFQRLYPSDVRGAAQLVIEDVEMYAMTSGDPMVEMLLTWNWVNTNGNQRTLMCIPEDVEKDPFLQHVSRSMDGKDRMISEGEKYATLRHAALRRVLGDKGGKKRMFTDMVMG
jgi:hypothetical protein